MRKCPIGSGVTVTESGFDETGSTGIAWRAAISFCGARGVYICLANCGTIIPATRTTAANVIIERIAQSAHSDWRHVTMRWRNRRLMRCSTRRICSFAVSGVLRNTRKLSRLAWLCPPRRGRGDRVVGPWVFRVTSAHFGAHGRVAAAPESRQVARGLYRPVRRRQQVDQQRHFAAGDHRMAVEAEQLLYADRNFRTALGLVVDRHPRAGRCFQMGGCLGLEAAS